MNSSSSTSPPPSASIQLIISSASDSSISISHAFSTLMISSLDTPPELSMSNSLKIFKKFYLITEAFFICCNSPNILLLISMLFKFYMHCFIDKLMRQMHLFDQYCQQTHKIISHISNLYITQFQSTVEYYITNNNFPMQSKKTPKFLSLYTIFLTISTSYAQQGSGGYSSNSYSSDSGSPGSCSGDQNLCTAQVAIYIVSTIVGLICAFIGAFKYCKYHHKYRNCSCHQYSKLKRKLNIVQPGTLTIQQFNTKSQQIIQIMSTIKNVSYMQAGHRYRMIVEKCKIINRKDYLHQIKIKGKDCNGQWTSYGYIYSKSGSVSLWFYKFYDKRTQAGQTQQWKHLLYQSNKIDAGLIAGKWYYLGLEDQDLYCGTWKFVSQPLFIDLTGENVSHTMTTIT